MAQSLPGTNMTKAGREYACAGTSQGQAEPKMEMDCDDRLEFIEAEAVSCIYQMHKHWLSPQKMTSSLLCLSGLWMTCCLESSST